MEIKKPGIGEPCNGCGVCCLTHVCQNGAFTLRLVSRLGESIQGPCPAIVRQRDGTIKCGIILNPNKYIKKSKYPARILSKQFSILIGSGVGCDELLDDDTIEEEEKLQQIIDSKMNDPQWVERTQRALRIIHGVF